MDSYQTFARFIDASPNAYYAVKNIRDLLEQAGYTELLESEDWNPESGKGYYIVRDQSSILAFSIPETARIRPGFQVAAAHTDSPAWKIKPSPEMEVEGTYCKLNTEKYGGMIYYTWLDRPLSVAGRVTYESENGVETRLVNIERDLVMIPSLAIHMDRKLNDGYVFHPQKDMLPLYGSGEKSTGVVASCNAWKKPDLMELLAKELHLTKDRILDADLYLYNRQPCTRFGEREEYIASGRLDDLQCAYGILQGFLNAKSTNKVRICAVFHNEEVGSSTKQGAASDFLETVMHRIAKRLYPEVEDYIRDSFLVSADNAHGLHPNYPEKADPTNRPVLNGGVVIKYNANQKYTTDAISGAVFKAICKKAQVPIQTYANHSDVPGGSTLGSIATARTSMRAVDIGLAQLAMHSAYETAGAYDLAYLIRAMEAYYSTELQDCGEGNFVLT